MALAAHCCDERLVNITDCALLGRIGACYDERPPGVIPKMFRGQLRGMSEVWWWFLLLGILWTLYGMFVLSYRVSGVTAVAVLVGVAFLFGGVAQIALST